MQLNKAIQNRWSPRGFSKTPVSDEMIKLLFEAARWAPSSRNEQPWTYFFAQRENSKIFDEFVGLLTGNNPLWAKDAQILIISVMSKISSYNNQPNGKALHDMGAASVSMAIQAAEMGIQIHQMGGFDKQKASEYLQLDTQRFEPVTMIAVGYPIEEKPHSEDQKNRKAQHETRKELSEFVFQKTN
ncbi:nitroreductase family protein [Maribellus maritimus]|uniref:nitroreductase family protein n=1 Tax=Maribellus maritimus TaxID=2870838 RepID=UPI001EEBF467|nr:nitroreductase family protein [Maribellus maritimus]MCG6186953.1 nitroreductase family protein [Maribellus maritimus]